jgi:hypothetical protein
MNFGQGNIGFVSNAINGGPPFPIGSADNGLSVDPASFKIVFGNDNTFAFGGTADLLSSREIFMAGFSIHFLDNVGTQSDVSISAASIGAADFGNSTTASIQANSNGAELFLSAPTPGTLPFIDFDLGGAGSMLIRNNAGNLQATDTVFNQFLSLDIINDIYAMGDLNTRTTGVQYFIDAGSGRIEFGIGSGGNRVMELLPFSYIAQFGDIDTNAGGLILKVDAFTQSLDLRNTALTAGIIINGNAGFTGTVTPVTTITVDNGIVTAVA